MTKLACINVDLDGLRHYEALYDLAAESRADAVAVLAPQRLAELLDGIGARGTFFAIGKEIPEGGEPLRSLAKAGHEIGNHTLSHPYALTRLPPDALLREVEGGAQAIADATGERPTGFRAPGYTLSAGLLQAVVATGHAYDSSVYPAAPYYFAKAAVLTALRARGRSSAAVLDRPRVLLAPRLPYVPGSLEPYARGDLPLFELPITVDPLLRIPFYGTLIVSAPWPIVRATYTSARRLPFLNLELHGVDLLGPDDGIGPAVARAFGDLRIPLAEKLRRLREVFSWIARDYQIVTLAEAANHFAERVETGSATRRLGSEQRNGHLRP